MRADMREVIIGAVTAFVVAVVTINFLGPKQAEAPPEVQQPEVRQLVNKRFDLSKMRGKERPFFRKNAAILAATVDAGTP